MARAKRATAPRIKHRSKDTPQIKQEDQDAALGPAIDQKNIFPFLELPPELRNNIYEYSMPNTESIRDRDLATLRLPTISRLNQQIRQECMGYLFESRGFDLRIGTNIRHRRVAQCSYSRWPPAFDQVADCGTLGLNPTVRSFLKRAAGKWAIFKDVSFHIFESFKIPDVRYTKLMLALSEAQMDGAMEFTRSKLALAVVRLTVQEGKLSISSQKNNNNKDDDELDKTLKDVTNAAEMVASRKGFKGLMTADLHKIAKTLYWKP